MRWRRYNQRGRGRDAPFFVGWVKPTQLPMIDKTDAGYPRPTPALATPEPASDSEYNRNDRDRRNRKIHRKDECPSEPIGARERPEAEQNDAIPDKASIVDHAPVCPHDVAGKKHRHHDGYASV